MAQVTEERFSAAGGQVRVTLTYDDVNGLVASLVGANASPSPLRVDWTTQGTAKRTFTLPAGQTVTLTPPNLRLPLAQTTSADPAVVAANPTKFPGSIACTWPG